MDKTLIVNCYNYFLEKYATECEAGVLNTYYMDYLSLSFIRKNLNAFNGLKSIGFLSSFKNQRYNTSIHGMVFNMDDDVLGVSNKLNKCVDDEIVSETMKFMPEFCYIEVNDNKKRHLVTRGVFEAEPGSVMFYPLANSLYKQNEEDLLSEDGYSLVDMSYRIRGYLTQDFPSCARTFSKNRSLSTKAKETIYGYWLKSGGKYYPLYKEDLINIVAPDLMKTFSRFNQEMLKEKAMEKNCDFFFNFTHKGVLEKNLLSIDELQDGTESFFWKNIHLLNEVLEKQYLRQNLMEKVFSYKGDFKEERINAIMKVAKTIIGASADKYKGQNVLKYGPISGANVFHYYVVQRAKKANLELPQRFFDLFPITLKKKGYLKIERNEDFEFFQVQFNYAEMLVKYIVESGGNFLVKEKETSDSQDFNGFKMGFLALFRDLVKGSETNLALYDQKARPQDGNDIVRLCNNNSDDFGELNKKSLQISINLIIKEILDEFTDTGSIFLFKDVIKNSLSKNFDTHYDIISTKYSKLLLNSMISENSEKKDVSFEVVEDSSVFKL